MGEARLSKVLEISLFAPYPFFFCDYLLVRRTADSFLPPLSAFTLLRASRPFRPSRIEPRDSQNQKTGRLSIRRSSTDTPCPGSSSRFPYQLRAMNRLEGEDR